MAATTFDLFFTGRDDPRSCVIIGEDTKPLYFCFETAERNLMSNSRTMVGLASMVRRDKLRSALILLPPVQVYRNNKEVCAKLDWSPGNHLGGATIGTRTIPMSHLVMPGSSTR